MTDIDNNGVLMTKDEFILRKVTFCSSICDTSIGLSIVKLLYSILKPCSFIISTILFLALLLKNDFASKPK